MPSEAELQRKVEELAQRVNELTEGMNRAHYRLDVLWKRPVMLSSAYKAPTYEEWMAEKMAEMANKGQSG